MHAKGGSGTEIVEVFFFFGRQPVEVVEEKERERNVNERESKKSNFFLDLEIGLECNK